MSSQVAAFKRQLRREAVSLFFFLPVSAKLKLLLALFLADWFGIKRVFGSGHTLCATSEMPRWGSQFKRKGVRKTGKETQLQKGKRTDFRSILVLFHKVYKIIVFRRALYPSPTLSLSLSLSVWALSEPKKCATPVRPRC